MGMAQMEQQTDVQTPSEHKMSAPLDSLTDFALPPPSASTLISAPICLSELDSPNAMPLRHRLSTMDFSFELNNFSMPSCEMENTMNCEVELPLKPILDANIESIEQTETMTN